MFACDSLGLKNFELQRCLFVVRTINKKNYLVCFFRSTPSAEASSISREGSTFPEETSSETSPLKTEESCLPPNKAL